MGLRSPARLDSTSHPGAILRGPSLRPPTQPPQVRPALATARHDTSPAWSNRPRLPTSAATAQTIDCTSHRNTAPVSPRLPASRLATGLDCSTHRHPATGQLPRTPPRLCPIPATRLLAPVRLASIPSTRRCGSLQPYRLLYPSYDPASPPNDYVSQAVSSPVTSQPMAARRAPRLPSSVSAQARRPRLRSKGNATPQNPR
jgi:hypothetical protein